MALRGSLDLSLKLHWVAALVKYVPDRMPRPSSRAPQSCLRRRVEGGEAETPVPPQSPERRVCPLAPAACQEGPRMCIFPLAGCKLESIFLNVAAVNTHRDRPQVPTASC